jgi:hypothetical protein
MPNIYFEELFEELGCPKPTPMSAATPQWYKDMDRVYGEHTDDIRTSAMSAGFRACPAISDSLLSGYTLYLPADVMIDATGPSVKIAYTGWLNGSEALDLDYPFIVKHDAEATSGYPLNHLHQESIKWQTYWGIKTDEGYSCLFTHPFHRDDLPFQMIPAIVDTDKMAARSPYAFFVRKGFNGVIPRGTPMLQVFPYKREEWTMHLVGPDREDHKKNKRLLGSVFNMPYRKIFWERKKYT